MKKLTFLFCVQCSCKVGQGRCVSNKLKQTIRCTDFLSFGNACFASIQRKVAIRSNYKANNCYLYFWRMFSGFISRIILLNSAGWIFFLIYFFVVFFFPPLVGLHLSCRIATRPRYPQIHLPLMVRKEKLLYKSICSKNNNSVLRKRLLENDKLILN